MQAGSEGDRNTRLTFLQTQIQGKAQIHRIWQGAGRRMVKPVAGVPFPEGSVTVCKSILFLGGGGMQKFPGQGVNVCHSTKVLQ